MELEAKTYLKRDPERYRMLSYKGRVMSDSRVPGYCGSCSYEAHCEQLDNPSSWVNEFIVDDWVDIALKALTEPPVPQGVVCKDCGADILADELRVFPDRIRCELCVCKMVSERWRAAEWT